MRRAIDTFPVGTGKGDDNIGPRAYSRLSDAALLALIALLRACEACGCWGANAFVVLIVLLPKPDGGLRPIGLFPSMIRIWGRARADVARAWEAAHTMPQFYGGSGMGAQRAAWIASFQAETATADRRGHVAGLLDLVKAFERVPHDRIAEAARRHGFPLALVRLSLAAYRLRRTIGVDGIFSALVVACRGITAGWAFATTELRLILITTVELACRWWPRAQITVYVDDITVAVSDALDAAARIVARVIDYFVTVLEGGLKLEVSVAKSVVVASRLKLALAAAQASRTRKLKPCRATKLLGAPAGGGARRSVRPLAVSMHAFLKRLNRLAAFRKQGGNAVKYVTTAALPAITYGQDVCGVSDTKLRDARSVVAGAVPPAGAGRNPDVVFNMLETTNICVDPAHAAHTMPIAQWATAWWEGWIPAGDLVRAHSQAVARLATAASVWACVAGPAAAVVATAARIGWHFVSAQSMQDDIGIVWDCTVDSPAAIRVAVLASVRRWRTERICKSFPGLASEASDGPLSCGLGTATALVKVDVSRALGPLVAGRRSTVCEVPSWEPQCAPWLVSAASGGQWPQAKRAAVRAWAADPNCQLCHAALGTIAHRRVCPATRPPLGWASEASPRAQAFTCRLSAERLRLLKDRAMLVVTLPAAPVVQLPQLRWLTSPPDLTDTRLRWFPDGSVVNATTDRYAVAACAIVVVGPVGSGGGDECDGLAALIAVAEVALPSKVRTAPAAETAAVALILAMTPSAPYIVTDCLGIIITAEAGAAAATAAGKPNAGAWCRIAHATDGDPRALVRSGRLRWMPSHATAANFSGLRKSDGSPVTFTEWRANRLADAVARRTAQRAAVDCGIVATVGDASEALVREAAILAACTRAANHCVGRVTRTDGTVATVTRRDSGGLVPPPAVVAARRAKRRDKAARSAEPRTAAALAAPPSRAARPKRRYVRGSCPAQVVLAARVAARGRKRAHDAAARAARADDAFALELVRNRVAYAVPSCADPASDDGNRCRWRRAAAALAAALAADGPATSAAAEPAAPPAPTASGSVSRADRRGAGGTRAEWTAKRSRSLNARGGEDRPPLKAARTSTGSREPAAPLSLAELVRAHTRARRPAAAPPSASRMRLSSP